MTYHVRIGQVELSRFFVGLLLLPTLALAQEKPAKLSPKDREIADEIRFADKLNQELRLPDYALRVLDALITKHPESAGKVRTIRIGALAMQGNFPESEKELAALTPGSAEHVAASLSLGDVYYASGNITKAREIYDSFLGKYPDGPPDDIREFYLRSADRFIQMLIQKGDNEAALAASRQFLKAKPEPDLARMCQVQMAELCLRSAVEGKGDRNALLNEGQELAEDVLWGEQDLAFAKALVALAHIHVEKGELDEARTIIEAQLANLRQIDDELRRQRQPMTLSPMAECRYMLGEIFEKEGREALDKGDKKKGVGRLKNAIEQLYTVCMKYGRSRWAPDAARKADEIVAVLKEQGLEVAAPDLNMKSLADAQLKEARSFASAGDWAGARAAYAKVLTQFPAESNKPGTVSAYAMACIQDNDPRTATMLTADLANRFKADTNLAAAAGSAILTIADLHNRLSQTNEAIAAYRLFIASFPRHEMAPFVLRRLGKHHQALKQYADAVPHYRTLVETYSNAPGYADALNRLAACQLALGAHSNAVSLLQRYAARLPPCADKADALLKVGNALRQSGRIAAAIKQYTALQQLLQKKSGNPYSPGAEDAARNAKTLQRAVFWTGHCYSLLTQPPEKVAAYRQKAVEAYSELLKDPNLGKELGPQSLAALATLYFLQDKADLADKTFQRLSKDYPDSPEARNALFTQGRSLLKIGQASRAIEVFQRMFDDPTSYKPAQFYQMGKLMAKSSQHETAIRAFTQAREGADDTVWSAATLGVAQSHIATGQGQAALDAADAMLAKMPDSPYAALLHLTRARAFGLLMRAETGDEKTRFGHYESAIKAIVELRKRTRSAVTRATAELELADIQAALGRKKEAIASLQRILLADMSDKTLHPVLESTYQRIIPLLIEAGAHQAAVDAAKQYLAEFPNGSYLRDVTRWREQASALVNKGN